MPEEAPPPSIEDQPLNSPKNEPQVVSEPDSEPIKKEEPSKPSPIKAPTSVSDKPRDTPSIFKRKKDKEENQDASTVVEKKSEVFTEDALQAAWSEFVDNQTDAGDTDKLILGKELKKGEDHKVIITLGSQLEVSFLERLEVDLIQHLRTTLNNDHIVLERQIAQEEESKKLYTSKDIFDYMIKQNPDLKDLKDRLGLDFDY